MLIKQRILKEIAAGRVDRAYRRWNRPLVRPGTQLRTPVGLLTVDAVDEVRVERLSEGDARRAGYPSRSDLLQTLRSFGTGAVYRIKLRYSGADPRIALRQRRRLSAADLAETMRRLHRLGTAGGQPRAIDYLRLIAENPGVLAGDLAATRGLATLVFKRRVRRLKELGLTESLEVGYRLSPRGATVMRALTPGESSHARPQLKGHPPGRTRKQR
jgi:hypothetical protein